MFEPIVEGIWTTARSQRFFGIDSGTRMTVVALPDGGLFVHCPVALDAETRAAVDALGEVRAVASSSLYHHLYAGEWMKAYPKAVFCACPGLDRKRADLAWNHLLGDEPHSLWKGTLEQVYFSARFEKEVVFFHPGSGTIIMADSLLNLRHHPSWLTRGAALLMGNTGPGKGYLERIAVRDYKAGRREVDRMLNWNAQRIVLAHGTLIYENGREVLREAYSWL